MCSWSNGKHWIALDKGDTLSIHTGHFFGTYDYKVRANGKMKVTIEFEEEPTDLLEGEGRKEILS